MAHYLIYAPAAQFAWKQFASGYGFSHIARAQKFSPTAPEGGHLTNSCGRPEGAALVRTSLAMRITAQGRAIRTQSEPQF
jgi:hypothetical protein